MAGQIGKWMSAVSDVDQAEKEAKNPPLFKKLMYASSIEQQALEAYAAKKKFEQQRYELKQFLMFTHGSKAWEELLQMEGQIRKRRQKEIYDRKIFREKVIGWIALTVTLAVGTVILGLFVYSLMGFDRGWW